MIEFEPGLRLSYIVLLFFFNLGAQNMCAQNRYTNVKIGLD